MQTEIKHLVDGLKQDIQNTESDAVQLISACEYYGKKIEADLNTAIDLLKDAVNWEQRPMLTGIAGARGDKIRAFLRKKEKESKND